MNIPELPEGCFDTLATEACVKQDEDLAYRQAFHYIVGCLTTRERLGMPPLPVAQLYQQVYDSYGVLPVESVVKSLKLEV